MQTRASAVTTLTLIALFVCPSAFSQDGLQLFHRMQKALGGAKRIAAVRDFEQTVRAETWNGNTGASLGEVRKRTRWIQPGYLRADQVGPGSTYVLYFDGTSGWEILPGTQKITDLAGGELQFAQKYIRDFILTTLLADRDPRYRITSPSPHVVRISDGDISHQLDITLDADSSLPVKTTSISLSDPAHPIPSETVIMEWETVQGIRFAKHWKVLRSGIRVAEITAEQTKLNGGLTLEDLAEKPSDLKPVLPN
jgi:hypothetical protein